MFGLQLFTLRISLIRARVCGARPVFILTFFYSCFHARHFCLHVQADEHGEWGAGMEESGQEAYTVPEIECFPPELTREEGDVVGEVSLIPLCQYTLLCICLSQRGQGTPLHPSVCEACRFIIFRF